MLGQEGLKFSIHVFFGILLWSGIFFVNPKHRETSYSSEKRRGNSKKFKKLGYENTSWSQTNIEMFKYKPNIEEFIKSIQDKDIRMGIYLMMRQNVRMVFNSVGAYIMKVFILSVSVILSSGSVHADPKRKPLSLNVITVYGEKLCRIKILKHLRRFKVIHHPLIERCTR